jgi:hypothetical protein
MVSTMPRVYQTRRKWWCRSAIEFSDATGIFNQRFVLTSSTGTAHCAGLRQRGLSSPLHETPSRIPARTHGS